jgi:hypothetical protein
VVPVKEMPSTPGCRTSASPTTGLAGNQVKNLGGRPTLSNASAKAKGLIGASLAGLSTSLQPTTSAAPILAAAWLSGQFHEQMAAITPTGSHTTKLWPTRVRH